jgi:hypothetical protein
VATFRRHETGCSGETISGRVPDWRRDVESARRQPSACGFATKRTNVTNRILTRDGESDKAARIYHDYFARHPEHPQAQRFIQEYRDLVADASALPNGENDDEGGISNDDC